MANLFPLGLSIFSYSLTHFESLHVLAVFWYSAFFRENPPHSKGLS